VSSPSQLSLQPTVGNNTRESEPPHAHPKYMRAHPNARMRTTAMQTHHHTAECPSAPCNQPEATPYASHIIRYDSCHGVRGEHAPGAHYPPDFHTSTQDETKHVQTKMMRESHKSNWCSRKNKAEVSTKLRDIHTCKLTSHQRPHISLKYAYNQLACPCSQNPMCVCMPAPRLHTTSARSGRGPVVRTGVMSESIL